MPTNELLDRYKKEFCSKCKNNCKEINVCEINIIEDTKTKEARCDNYEEKGKQAC